MNYELVTLKFTARGSKILEKEKITGKRNKKEIITLESMCSDSQMKEEF